jgi:hypothetical protein
MGCGSSTEPPPPVDPEVVQRVYFAAADPELHADCDFGVPEEELVSPPQPSSSGRGAVSGASTADTHIGGGRRASGVGDAAEAGDADMEPSELAIALERRRLVALARIKHGINGDIAQFPALAPASTTLASARQRVGHWFKLNEHLIKQADQRSAENRSALSSPASFVDYSSNYHPNQPHPSDEAGGTSTAVLNTSFHSEVPPSPSAGLTGSARARGGTASSNGTPLSAANSGFGTPVGFRSRAGSDISSVDSHFSGQSGGPGGAGFATSTRLTSRTLYRHQVRLRQVGVPFAVDVRIDAPSMTSYGSDADEDGARRDDAYDDDDDDDDDGDGNGGGGGGGHRRHRHRQRNTVDNDEGDEDDVVVIASR